jgi:hypothetical protein
VDEGRQCHEFRPNLDPAAAMKRSQEIGRRSP